MRFPTKMLENLKLTGSETGCWVFSGVPTIMMVGEVRRDMTGWFGQ